MKTARLVPSKSSSEVFLGITLYTLLRLRVINFYASLVVREL